MLRMIGFVLFPVIFWSITWVTAVHFFGKIQHNFECVVQQEKIGKSELSIGRLFIGADEYRWFARIFRWEKKFDVKFISDDLREYTWTYGTWSSDREIKFFGTLLGTAQSGTLNLLTGNFQFISDGSSYLGTCNRRNN